MQVQLKKQDENSHPEEEGEIGKIIEVPMESAKTIEIPKPAVELQPDEEKKGELVETTQERQASAEASAHARRSWYIARPRWRASSHV